jgi:predicted nucleotidyltransferase
MKKEIVSKLQTFFPAYPIEKAWIFGSYARGDAKDTSDVDLAIDSGGQLFNWNIFALGGDLLSVLPVRVDVYDILEIEEVLNRALDHSRFLVNKPQKRLQKKICFAVLCCGLKINILSQSRHCFLLKNCTFSFGCIN